MKNNKNKLQKQYWENFWREWDDTCMKMSYTWRQKLLRHDYYSVTTLKHLLIILEYYNKHYSEDYHMELLATHNGIFGKPGNVLFIDIYNQNNRQSTIYFGENNGYYGVKKQINYIYDANGKFLSFKDVDII